MPEIETLILANHAEAHDGLLYLMGAGWTDLKQLTAVGQPPPPFHVGIGMTVLVGWNETNQRHRVLVYLEPEDGGEVLLRVEAELEMGRPAGIVEGVDQRAVLAFSGQVFFANPGGYRFVAELGPNTRQVSFRVHHDPVAPSA